MEKKILTPMLVATLAHFSKRIAANWDSAMVAIQDVLVSYKKTGLPALNSEELGLLFNDTENLLYSKLTGGEQAHLKMGKGEGTHLAIDKKAAMQLITKPEGYDALLADIKYCTAECLKGWEPNSPCYIRFGTNAIKDLFVIDADGKLDFTDKVKNEIAEAGNIYAKTEKGQAVYLFLQKVTAAFCESGLDKYRSSKSSTFTGDDLADIMRDGIRLIDVETKEFVPNTNQSMSAYPRLPFDNNEPNI